MWLVWWLSKTIRFMKLTYVLKSKSIYYRFRNGRNLSVLRKLPYEIQEKDWSTAKQCTKPKNLEKINIQLLKFKAYLLEEVNIAISNDTNINLEWIKHKQHSFFNTSNTKESFKVYLKEYLGYYIEKENPSSTNFNILKNHIPTTTRIIDVDLKWIEKFSKDKLKTYAESTVGKHIQQLKLILKHAEQNGIKIRRSAYDFRIKQYSTINTFLNEEEMELIFDYEPETDYLKNTRKLLLVGCTTGLRVSDLMRIKQFELKNDSLELITKKTNQPITVPLDPRVKDFIAEVRPISHQKFNKYLKILCRKIGLVEPTKGYIRDKQNMRVLGFYPKYKLITSHTMRRSFATNLYGKVPTVVIMAITGHTTEKSFLTYIKKPQRDFAEQLKSYYNSTYKTV